MIQFEDTITSPGFTRPKEALSAEGLADLGNVEGAFTEVTEVQQLAITQWRTFESAIAPRRACVDRHKLKRWRVDAARLERNPEVHGE
jgi:hypothetical protein